MSLNRKISSAIFGNRPHAFIGDDTDNIFFDAILSFSETDNYNVTSHAIEEGGDIADHIDSKPKMINFTAILTDDDWSVLDPASFVNLTIEDKFLILEDWKETKPLLTYYGHTFDIENLVLTSVIKNKSVNNGDGWELSISMQCVNVAVSEKPTISLSKVTIKGDTAKGTTTTP